VSGLETRLPAEDWFVRSITRPGAPASKQIDAGSAGLALNTGQRITDLTVTVAEGAGSLRGKVVPATEGSRFTAAASSATPKPLPSLREQAETQQQCLKLRLESSKKLTFSVMLFYAFSPFRRIMCSSRMD